MVANTNSGTAPSLRAYYAHWEAAIFGALNRMVTRGLARLLDLLSPREAQVYIYLYIYRERKREK